MSDVCANCKADISQARETGMSSLYNPGNGPELDLCVRCWREEEALIEASGTNNHPARLAHYHRRAA